MEFKASSIVSNHANESTNCQPYTHQLELDQWLNACAAFDSKDYETAVQSFLSMADNAKMHFNIGLIFAIEDDHQRALAAYSRAISMDAYFAVAYFQKGVSQFVMNNMEAAMHDFDNAYQRLRGNEMINYTQLGLAFRLYACEVLFNRGVCQLYLGKIDAGLTDLYHAQKAKMTEEHDVIDQAVRDRGRGYSVFSIPPGVLYRPSEARMRQLQNANMFAAVDKLSLPNKNFKTALTSIQRNNSILLPDAQWADSPHPSISSTSSFSSSLRQRADGRRVDSGFESTHEERYSSSSGRSSTKSHKANRYSPPPVPPIPHNASYEYGDTSANYGNFDLDEMYGSLPTIDTQDNKQDRVRPRLNISTPTLKEGSINTKIRVKVHYTDTRILLVPHTITFNELLGRVREKFGAPPSTRLQYKDEEEEMVLMIDDDDLHLVRQTSRQKHGDFGVEKIEIWCVT
ncbi:hypothetical protein J3Q64DRAFT_1646935 [Phycomyces blakesleeanus]|uniref:PB1 domain-containing protein n=1 Tax=Phycomyces blakesleeanus TaxID=4837 RepID=A0ABR3AM63_PHYBL